MGAEVSLPLLLPTVACFRSSTPLDSPSNLPSYTMQNLTTNVIFSMLERLGFTESPVSFGRVCKDVHASISEFGSSLSRDYSREQFLACDNALLTVHSKHIPFESCRHYDFQRQD